VKSKASSETIRFDVDVNTVGAGQIDPVPRFDVFQPDEWYDAPRSRGG
jgi:hypothetical protein